MFVSFVRHINEYQMNLQSDSKWTKTIFSRINMEARFSVSKKEEEKKVAMYVNISACKCFLVAQQASWLLLTKKK